MDPPESIQVEAPPRSPSQLEQAPQRRRRGARLTELTLIATISYVILSLFKSESSVRNNYSVQNIPREFDSPAGWQGKDKGDTTNIPRHSTHAHAYDLEHNLRALQELTIGKQNNDDDDGNNSCPPPLKLYKNQIAVTPSHINHTTTTTKIPQILHLSERSRCLNRDLYDAIQMWHKSFPSFSIFFHDDAAVDRLLYSKEAEYSDWRSEFPDIVKILPCVAPGAMKIDIWRVLVLWKYGGMYSDVDVVPNTDMLTERTIHPDSEWFSLSDAWKRPSQWFFATSAHHMSMKNSLHIIAERVLGVENVQKTRLVHVTGPQSLYWGWKDSLRNETEKMNQMEESESVSAAPPAADQVTGTIITFKDGSWGQWIEAKSNIEWHNASYWGEMVPFEETECVSRKARSQKHFGRVHWVTAQSSGQTGLPQISCRKHLENVSQKVVEQGEQPKVAATSEGGAPSPSNEAATLSDKSIADLILKNSNNSTMCAYLASENLRKIEELRNNSTYCGFCRWTGGNRPVTCDARMDYMMGKYQLSPEEAFMHVMEKEVCKHSTYLNERPPPAHLMAAHMEALSNVPNPP